MKRWIETIIISVLMFAGQSAFAGWGNDAFRLSDTKSVSVKLSDYASDGCWTNLRETREYAEEKLRAKGANMVPQFGVDDNHYQFDVSVDAFRTKTGCVANIDLSLYTMASVKNLKGELIGHFAVVAGVNNLFSGFDKMNNEVLNLVKEFINDLK